MGIITDKEQQRLDHIYSTALAQRQQRDHARRKPPLIRLWSPKSVGWDLRGIVAGEIEASFEWKLNDTGSGKIVFPFDHHLAQWCMQWWKRDKKNIFITVDKDGARWSGMAESVTTQQDDEGVRTVTITFLDDFEQLKHLPCWPNPFTPAGLQFPKSFMMAAPAAYMLKTFLFLNLLRHNTSLWQLPDDPLDPRSWLQGLFYKDWPILIQPRSIFLDETPLRFAHSRFKNWYELAAPILEETRMMVTYRRWLIGDPQPWPGAGLRRNGQLIIDIVDKSGWWDQTATGGTLAGGLIRTGLEIADNLVDEARFILDRPADAPEYAVSGFLGVAPQQPWVVYRTNNPTNVVTSTEYTWKPATVAQITVGGKSAPGVNEFISAHVKLVFNVLGSFILQPSLGGIVDTLVGPLYEDVILAFMSVKSPMRSKHLGWGHYMENFASGGDQAYTLSSLLALRKGFTETKEIVSHTVGVNDGAPYLVGDQGQGHFFLGDRIGVETPGSRDGHVDVAQVTSLQLSWAVESPHEWAITVGEFPKADPLEWAIDQVKELSGGLQDLGLL